MATFTKWRLQDFVFESTIKISEDHAGVFLVRSGGTPYVLKVVSQALEAPKDLVVAQT